MKKIVIFGVLGVLMIIAGISLHSYIDYQSSFALAIIFSVLCGFFIFLGFNNLKDIFVDSGFEDEEPVSYGMAILAALGSLVFLLIFFNAQKNYVIEKEGVLVEGKVIAGFEETRGNNTDFNLTIEFKNVEGNSIQIVKKVSRIELESKPYLYMPIDLIYYKENPEISKVLFKSNEIKKFKKIEDRNLTVNDLCKLDSLTSNKSKLEFLNKISSGWIESQEDSKRYFVNERKNELVGFEQGNLIFIDKNRNDYVSFLKPIGIISENTLDNELFNDSKKQEGNSKPKTVDEMLGNEMEYKLIETKKYSVICNLNMSAENSDGSTSMANIYYFTKK